MFLPVEIIGEILLFLPIAPLHRFKLVSKQWNCIISDPDFGLDYLNRANSSPPSSRLWTMAYLSPNSDTDQLPDNIRSLSQTISTPRDQPPPLSVFSLPPPIQHHAILASSNGLILSSDLTPGKRLFCILNPLTSRFATLPPPTENYGPVVAGFAARRLTYKVVLIHHQLGSIEIFSSNTGTWRTVKKLINCPQAVKDHQGFSYNGILHWLDRSRRTIVTYDPYDSPFGFGSIRLPNGARMNLINSAMNLIYSGDYEPIRYSEVEDYTGARDLRLCVWRLVDYDKGEWWLDRRRPKVNPYWCRAWLLNDREPLASDPWKQEVLFYSDPLDHWFVAFDLATATKEVVDPFDSTGTSKRSYRLQRRLIPLALSPWSSPWYNHSSKPPRHH